jgi:von Willebrand factor type A domain
VLDPLLAQRGCVDITRSYTSVPATVMLLIDQSGSMAQGGFGMGTRWDVLREAIVDPEHGLLAWLDQSASVGLMMYTSFDGFASDQGCPVITRVDAQIGNADRLRLAYSAEEPAPRGDTPTGESIDAAALQLGRVQGTAPKYILLLTDGAPDTCAQPDPQWGLPQAIEAAQRAVAQGIRVYTVGVSEEINGADLQALANAGAGKDPDLVYERDPGAEQPLFARTDPQQLADQLKGIIGDVRSCSVDLGTTVDSARGLAGRLVLDGQTLLNDARNGWTFVDERTVLIHGAACEKILGDGERLEVRFPCRNDFTPPR